jgi:hypothetical protein
LAWAPGEPFGGPSDSAQSRRKVSPLHRQFLAQTVTGILAVLLPLAYASPPDPTWIAGIYDNADYDDVVALVTDGTGASGRQTLARVERGPEAFVLFPERGPIPDRMLRVEMSRGPPLEAPDAPVSLEPNTRHVSGRDPPQGYLSSTAVPIYAHRSARRDVSVRSSPLPDGSRVCCPNTED